MRAEAGRGTNPLKTLALVLWPHGAHQGAKVAAYELGGHEGGQDLEALVVSWREWWPGLPTLQAEGMDWKGGLELHFCGRDDPGWMQSRKEGRVKALFMLSTVNTYRVLSKCPTLFQSLRETAADLTAALVQLSVHTDVHPYCYQPTWCSAGECRLAELPEWCSRESDPARVCVCSRGCCWRESQETSLGK